MSNETKRDVFEKALREWDDLVHSCGLQGEEAHGGCEFDPILIKYNKDYDAALPDDLPVIPDFVADYIDYCKRDIPHSPSHIGVGSAMQQEYMGVCMPDEVDMWLADNDLDTNVKHEELFARAWLDGFQTED